MKFFSLRYLTPDFFGRSNKFDFFFFFFFFFGWRCETRTTSFCEVCGMGKLLGPVWFVEKKYNILYSFSVFCEIHHLKFGLVLEFVLSFHFQYPKNYI